MKRRSFLFATASLPLLGSVPPYFPAPLLVKPKVILLRTAVDFDLTPIFMSGALVHYEAASNTIRVDLAAEYDDGSVRNFICDNKKWHYETINHEHELIIDGDTITYRRPSNIAGDHLSCVCTFKNVKEVFDGI
jgi:hypothetical protein